MKIFLAFSLATLCIGAPSVRPALAQVSFDVDYEDFDDRSYQIWVGPGWYYGIWFTKREVYYNWLEHRFYELVWTGRGWYYGIWFEHEYDFNAYRSYHRFYGYDHGDVLGDPIRHQSEHRGEWRGGGLEREGSSPHPSGSRHGGKAPSQLHEERIPHGGGQVEPHGGQMKPREPGNSTKRPPKDSRQSIAPQSEGQYPEEPVKPRGSTVVEPPQGGHGRTQPQGRQGGGTQLDAYPQQKRD